MDEAMSIAASSLNAERVAMTATSENVANAQTPGYVDETAQVSTLPGGDSLGVGDGVEVTTVSQATNALLAANNWQAQGALANLGSLQQSLTAIEDVFPLASEPSTSASSTTTNASLSGQLANFWSAWDAIAEAPSSLAPRTEIVNMAQGLVTSLSEAATQLTQVQTNSTEQLGNQVEQVNSLLSQVAELNQSIVTTEGSGASANQLVDQLNAAVSTLSELAGVDVRMLGNGTAAVSIGGVAVVQGDNAATLSLSTTGGVTSVVASPGGVTAPISSGSMAGLLSSLNQYLPDYRQQLDTVADDLASTVNGQLAAGYTASGASGATDPLFVGTGAAGLAVNPAVVADPMLLAASGTAGAAAANDGSNAQAVAELGTVTTGPDAAYQTLVQSIGADTQNVNSQLEAQTSVANQAEQAQQAVSGVNMTQELTNLVSFQQNYEASAKLMTVVDATVQSLLTAV
jgi:flagellar hook-associated protein 1 FlgK